MRRISPAAGHLNPVLSPPDVERWGPRIELGLRSRTGDGTLKTGTWQHVAFIVDGGPKLITVLVDGVLNDGGPVREYGWSRFDRAMGDVNGAGRIVLAPKLFGNLETLRIYDRYLTTSEAAGNWRAGRV